MSLFFEDEIRKVMDKAGPSERKELMSQDPRLNGQLPSRKRQVFIDPSTRDDSHKRYR